MPFISKNILRFTAFFSAVLLFNVFGQNTLTVQIDSAKSVVNKELFGVLMERLGRNWVGGAYVGDTSHIPNTNGIRNDIINGFIECGVGLIEWPGGCAANTYTWAADTNPANDVGTVGFMQLVNEIGCEPMITVPAPATSASSSLSWIKYINNNPSHPDWQVKYVKIGNEVYGCGGNMSGESVYEPDFLANYDSLVNPVNGRQLFIIGANQLTMSSTFTWMDTELVRIGSKMNGIEAHYYIYDPSSVPCVNFTGSEYMSVVNAANHGTIGPNDSMLCGNLTKYSGGKVKLVEDEWGDWLEPFNTATDAWMQQITLMDALSAAEQLHVFMHHADQIQIACLAQAVNVIHSLFLTRINGDLALVKTPTFYIFKMFMPHHSAGAKWAPNTVTTGNLGGVSLMSAGTTVDTLGHVNVSISNIDTVKSDTVHINLTAGGSSYSITNAQIITGPAKNSYNDFDSTEKVNIQTLAATNYSMSTGTTATVIMPKMSIIMLQFSPPTAVRQSRSFQELEPKQFSIRSGLNGSICITANVRQDKAVMISLYSMAGKLLDRASKKFLTANSSFVFGSNLKSNGVYMVKIEGVNGSFSRNIVIAP